MPSTKPEYAVISKSQKCCQFSGDTSPPRKSPLNFESSSMSTMFYVKPLPGCSVRSLRSQGERRRIVGHVAVGVYAFGVSSVSLTKILPLIPAFCCRINFIHPTHTHRPHRAFSVSAARASNSFPTEIRSSDTRHLQIQEAVLKTYISDRAFCR